MTRVLVFGTMSVPGVVLSHSPEPIRRVRSENPSIAALIEHGTARSTTFRGLVATIDGTDGLVYIEEGQCGRSVHACLAMVVTVAGPHRMLRIQINPRRPRRAILSSIGHELRHAIEVLSDPGVRSNAAIFEFFSRTGPTARERFETLAAIRAGIDVCGELGEDE